MSTKGNRAIDMLITYRVLKILTTPFEKQDAFKFGIIDKNGKVLRRYRDVSKSDEKKTYTWLHRFVFNIKRLLGKAGLGGRLGSLGVALALLLKEEDMITLGFKTGHKRKLLAAIMRLREAPKITSKGDVAKRKRKAAKKFASKYAT